MANPSKSDKYNDISPIEDISTNKIFKPSKNLNHPSRFTIPQETLVAIISACQERTFSEEIDLLETYPSFDNIYHKSIMLNYK